MGGFLITWASTSMMEYDLKEDRIPLYYVLIVGLIISLCGIVAFENLIMVYIFIELSTFLAVGIVMIKDEEKNYKAGMKYLLLSLLASSILLMGLIILYNITSSIMIDEIGIRLNNLSTSKDKIFLFLYINFNRNRDKVSLISFSYMVTRCPWFCTGTV